MLNELPAPLAQFLSPQVRGLLLTVGFLDIIDIIVVAIILYQLYKFLENTSATTLVKGIIFLFIIMAGSSVLGLHVIHWLLEKTLAFLFLAIPIIFQPELRRTLEHIGQSKFFPDYSILSDEEAENIIAAIDEAVVDLSSTRTGALIVCERDKPLNELVSDDSPGIPLDALITSDLLRHIFIVNTPLHDGAVIIRGKRIVKAGCVLPLTKRRFSSELGTRHRAAIGLSEQCDALVIVVSEETGIVSVTENGQIKRRISSEALKIRLRQIFSPEKKSLLDFIFNWRKKK